MKSYLLILPIALLVTYSQIMTKWRAGSSQNSPETGILKQLATFLSDPFIISAYVAALVASFAWLYVVTKLPLTVAFPVYIGITFALVMLGGVVFLSETLTFTKTLAVILIMSGIVLGMNAEA